MSKLLKKFSKIQKPTPKLKHLLTYSDLEADVAWSKLSPRPLVYRLRDFHDTHLVIWHGHVMTLKQALGLIAVQYDLGNPVPEHDREFQEIHRLTDIFSYQMAETGRADPGPTGEWKEIPSRFGDFPGLTEKYSITQVLAWFSPKNILEINFYHDSK